MIKGRTETEHVTALKLRGNSSRGWELRAVQEREKEQRKVEKYGDFIQNMRLTVTFKTHQLFILSLYLMFSPVQMQKRSFCQGFMFKLYVWPPSLTHHRFRLFGGFSFRALNITFPRGFELWTCEGFKKGIGLLSSYVSTWHHVSAFLSWLTWQVFGRDHPGPGGGWLALPSSGSVQCKTSSSTETLHWELFSALPNSLARSFFFSYQLHFLIIQMGIWFKIETFLLSN